MIYDYRTEVVVKEVTLLVLLRSLVVYRGPPGLVENNQIGYPFARL